MSKYLVTRANFIIFLGLIAMLLLIGGVTWDRWESAQSARRWTRHTYDTIAAINDLTIGIATAENAARSVLLTGEDDDLAPYQAAAERIGPLLGALQRLTGDSQTQQERLRALDPLLLRKLDELADAVRARREGDANAALRFMRGADGIRLADQIAALLGAMKYDEQRLLAQRAASADDRSAWVLRLALAGTVLAVAILLWAARLLNQAWRRSYRAEREQRGAAMRLRISLDSLSHGVAVFGADWTLTNWNECFQVLLDLPNAMVRPGTPYAAFGEHLAKAGEPFLETEDQVRHGQRRPSEPVVYERMRDDGRHLELRRTSMPDGGFVLTISDMTRRAQAEAVLRESQKMEAIGHLTGGIAHDFNNLLTVILGNLDLLRQKPDGDEKLRKRIERAIWAAQRGAALTRQLLAFARRQPLEPAPIDLAATMPEMVPLLRRTLGETIEVRYVETAGLWPAMADPAQLEAAVLNLALNARDAMPGGGRLTIELANKVLDDDYARQHAEVTAGDYTMLAVSDTGHGMTPAIVARVFEPFFTTKPDGKGTGLGLAMVFGFVKQSGGHINVYSEPGEGTTVRLYLPRAAGVAAAPLQRGTPPLDLPRGSAMVLVVEDEPAVREIAVAILGDLGYRVLEAADGEEGLRVFGAHAAAIDLLLTDVVLPGRVRGRELAERITAVRPEVRVLYMSGYTENSIVHNGRLDDGVELISKPFKREQLARRVFDLLAARARPAGKSEDNVVELKRRGE